ncbi:MAG: DUF349 domain-containing protein [Pseudomonadota bacterium]
MLSFLKRLLRKRHSVAKPSQPSAATLDDIHDAAELADVVETVNDKAVQVGAITRMSELGDLESFSHHSNRDVRHAARTRLLELLLPDTAKIDEISDPNKLILIAGATNDESLAKNAIAQLPDQDKLLALARDHQSANVRFAAAQNISDLTVLSALARGIGRRDKRVLRLCRQRLDADQKREKAERDYQAAITQWYEDINALVSATEGRTLERIESKAKILENRWRKLEPDAPDDVRLAAEHALTRLSELVASDAAERERAIVAAKAMESASADQAQVIAALEEGLSERLSIEDMEASWARESARWRSAVEQNPPTPSIETRFDTLCELWWQRREAMDRLQASQEDIEATLAETEGADRDDIGQLRRLRDGLAQFERELDWPSGVRNPELLERMDIAEQTLRETIESLAADSQTTLAEVDDALVQAQQALDAGQVKQATQAHRKATTLLRRLDRKPSQSRAQKAQQVHGQLRALQDWQSYAVTPKREGLVEAMEQLAEATPDDPQARADQINALQQEWKSLSGHGGNDLWKRFKAAADRAYDPCRAHFGAQAQVREQTLQARFALCEELERYEATLDWQNANWPLVKQTLEAAQQQFRDLSPVDRAGHNKSRKRFKHISDKVYARLRAEYDRNLELKRQVVTRAERLAEAADGDDADLPALIDAAKSLQGDWQAIGIVPNRSDQKMWRQFRQACDAIFAKRDAERAERRDALDSAIAAAQASVDELESNLPGMTNVHQRLEELTDRLRASDIPNSVRQALIRRLESATRTQQRNQRAKADEAERVQWRNLFEALEHCRANGERAEAPDFSDPSRYPAGIALDALARRWQSGTPASLTDDIRSALRAQCVDLEIALSVASPDADQSLRMQRQMERLAEGFGAASSDDLIARINTWIGSPIESNLDERFVEALRQSRS